MRWSEKERERKKKKCRSFDGIGTISRLFTELAAVAV